MGRLASLILLAVPLPAVAQGVLVAPHAVFIDHRTRGGWIQLYNPGSEATEVSIEALFGYPSAEAVHQPIALIIPVERRAQEARAEAPRQRRG